MDKKLFDIEFRNVDLRRKDQAIKVLEALKNNNQFDEEQFEFLLGKVMEFKARKKSGNKPKTKRCKCK
jgi:hypothetical protein